MKSTKSKPSFLTFALASMILILILKTLTLETYIPATMPFQTMTLPPPVKIIIKIPIKRIIIKTTITTPQVRKATHKMTITTHQVQKEIQKVVLVIPQVMTIVLSMIQIMIPKEIHPHQT